MSFFQIVKRWDWVVIITLLLLSFLPSAVFSYQQAGISEDNSEFIAVISVDNKVIKEVTLTGNIGHEILDLDDIPCHDSHQIEILDNQIRMKVSDCPDQVCVLTNYISRPGQTIICLHHRVFIEIKAVQGNSETEDIIISY
ncbi:MULTISPECIES: NusG domain II-containing protein [Bacillaceae]|uniref:NusG domain II-containing protein n=1 Tax=Evansella alkalicola TaxID=745819 RepID=A0ABS6JX26_9BACI|nr:MULTISPECIES: NusG domain II-containing protein [Bacillaceae]MBU9721665.1 NusG domain II-containing protein [Bacillus alkalicola]